VENLPENAASAAPAPSAESGDPLPSTLLLTAGCDVLRDEGQAYAERLAALGVPAPPARNITGQTIVIDGGSKAG
jgi:acetyl esterase/lipase